MPLGGKPDLLLLILAVIFITMKRVYPLMEVVRVLSARRKRAVEVEQVPMIAEGRYGY